MQRESSLFWSLQAGGWIAFAAAMSLGRIGELSLAATAAIDWALAGLGFVVTLVLSLVYSRVRLEHAGIGRVVAISVAGSYVAALVWTAAYNGYADHLADDVLLLLTGERVTFAEGPLLDNTVFHSLVLLAWSTIYFGIRSHGALQAERERSLRAESQAAEAAASAERARLAALRFQLNPHFLFNTLNAVSTLILEERGREANEMIARLSDFLRLTLEGGSAPEVPLAEELEFVEKYLEIEQLRFGERLRVALRVDDAVLSAPVPALILQPLVENAVRYAVAPRAAGGTIIITARATGGRLRLRVADDGPGLARSPAAAGHGIGLANTRERLWRRYGDLARLDLVEAEGGGLAATLEVPLAAPFAAAPALRPAG